MKYLLMALAALILSCNQSSNPNYQLPPVSGSISYVVNQTDTVTWTTGSFGWLGSITDCQPFVFSQAQPGNAYNGISLQIVTDTLKTGCYSDSDSWTCPQRPFYAWAKHNNIGYTMSHGDGSSYIEFTEITDTTMTGLFQLRLYNNTDTILIHNGFFNVVRYNRA
jgi:hypothetical protein